MKIISNERWKEIQDTIKDLEKQIEKWEDIDLENIGQRACYESKIKDMQAVIDLLTNKNHKYCKSCANCNHHKVAGCISYCDLDSICKDFKPLQTYIEK